MDVEPGVPDDPAKLSRLRRGRWTGSSPSWATGASGTRAEQARFAANIVASAAAPTNFLVTNPAALKRAFDTGGMSLARGARNFARDVRHNGAMPSMIEPGAFEVGRDLAVTPGAVVARDAVAEVLQYAPATDTVFARPVLVVPPPIGRFYFLDLRPGRSFVEYAAGRGLQTFMLSWRNPTAEQGRWDLDTYAADGVGGHRHRAGDHRQPGCQPDRLLRLAASSPPPCSTTWPPRAPTACTASRMPSPCWTSRWTPRSPPSPGGAWSRLPAAGHGARASSPASLWAARSPGSALITWCSTTG